MRPRWWSHTMGVMESTALLPTQLFRDGARDITPLTIGYIPMALAIGATIAKSPIDPTAGWAGGPLIAGGSAQLTLIEVSAAGAGVVAAVVAALAVNLRLVAYGAGMARWFGGEDRRWRVLIGYLTIDATYLLATRRFSTDDPGPALRRWYALGMGAVLYPIWAIAMGVGVVMGSAMPMGLELDKAAVFMMVGLVALSTEGRTHSLAAIVGGACGLASSIVPPRLAPIAAAALAVMIAGRERSQLVAGDLESGRADREGGSS